MEAYKLKILYIGLFSSEGGISKNFIDLGAALAKKVQLYSVVGNSDVENQIPGERGRLIININRDKPLNMFLPFEALKVKKYADAYKIDAVLYVANSPANMEIMKKLKRYNQYAFLHNPIPHIDRYSLFSIIENRINIASLRYCKKIFVASNTLKKKISSDKRYTQKMDIVEVVYLGQQTSMLYDIKSAEEDIDVLFFGRFEFYKGLDVLLKAISQLPNVNCTIIGKGDLSRIVGSDIQISSNVTVINEYMPDKELAVYISKCKVFVMPYREATGTQIIQTVMYYGKPIIATDTGCFPEYLENGVDSIIVKPESVSELEAAIIRLLDDPNLRKKMGDNARLHLNHRFSNDVLADKYIELIGEC